MAVPVSYYGVSYYETGPAWKARETGINRDYTAISATLGVARMAK
jgi:hypothetical protein